MIGCLDHPEYKDSIVEFKSFFPEEIINSEEYKSNGSFHGPFVISRITGKNTGVAPDIKFNYMEVPL